MDLSIMILVTASAFFAAALTVPAGFGLSTILTPIVLLVLPPHEAVAVVALVHAAHNGAKTISMWESIEFSALKRYGVWLIVGSVIGASLQGLVPQKPMLGLMGAFLVCLPILALSESWTGYRIPEANDRLGGFGSGFMGGLSGHQGAIRAMFLSRRLPNKLNYAATASILALCVDLTRIPVYLLYRPDAITGELAISLALVISAVSGVRLGKIWLKSLESDLIQKFVTSGIVLSGVYYIHASMS